MPNVKGHATHIVANPKGSERPFKVKCKCGWSMDAEKWEYTSRIEMAHLFAVEHDLRSKR